MSNFKIQGALVLNVFILAVIFFAASEKISGRDLFLISALGGFFMDALTSLPLGASIAGSLASAFIVKKISAMFFERSFVSMGLIFFCGVLIYYLSVSLVSFVIFSVAGQVFHVYSFFDIRVFLTSVSTALFGLVIYGFFRRYIQVAR